jgi:hypothetical protein
MTKERGRRRQPVVESNTDDEGKADDKGHAEMVANLSQKTKWQME